MHFKSLAYILLGQSALTAAQSPTPTSTSAKATASCEPHGDHWHCPSGVPQPTLNPDGSVNPKADHGDNDDDHDHDHSHDHDDDAATATATADSNGCTPHGDHWHCPSGVPKPTTPPPGYTASASLTGSSTSSTAPSSSPATGAATKAGSLGLAVVLGSSLLVGALFL